MQDNQGRQGMTTQADIDEIRMRLDGVLHPHRNFSYFAKAREIFIEHAPDDISYLLTKIGELSSKLRELQGDDRTVEQLLSLSPAERIGNLKRLVKANKDKLDVAIAALLIFADIESYTYSCQWNQTRGDVPWEIASDALRKIMGDV
jgi:hypothetical protein